MTVNDIQALYDYDSWANGKLFQVISQLTPEQFTGTVGGSYGSIRNTLVHVLSAEWGWLSRCGGPDRGPRLNPADFPNLESVTELWTRVEAYYREFLSALKDQDLARNVEYPSEKGEKRSMPMGELLQHTATHGVHHRGQVALLLRELGYAPGYLDLLVYYSEKRGVSAW